MTVRKSECGVSESPAALTRGTELGKYETTKTTESSSYGGKNETKVQWSETLREGRETSERGKQTRQDGHRKKERVGGVSVEDWRKEEEEEKK